jgi:putative hydrolase of the HAD superfamily
MHAALRHVRNWVFDLDNTLYPSSSNLFALIDERIGAYVADLFACDPVEARRIQKQYFFGHGTTLSGLMTEREVDPHHYLAYVHDIDMSALQRNEPLIQAIARLPGRKLVFTNGDATYAGRVLDRLGLGESFEAIHDIHATAYQPKPHASAYWGLCEAYDLAPEKSLFVDDMARNLQPAKAIGMTTVWVDNGSEQAQDPDADRSFIDFTTTDISQWLHDILEDPS